MITNPQTIQALNRIEAAIQQSYDKFLIKGIKYTQTYLNTYSGTKKLFAEKFMSEKSREYHGAKRALEEMLKASKK